MAQFCLITKMTPTEYRALTTTEYYAFIKMYNEMNEASE